MAAAEAAVEDGRSIEVIDLRLDFTAGRRPLLLRWQRLAGLIVKHEAPKSFGGMGGELAAAITMLLLQPAGASVGGYYYAVPGVPLEEYVPDIDRGA